MSRKSCCIIITTTNDKKVAITIATNLIQNKLVACVQIDKVSSYFYWEACAKQMKEYRLMIKSLSDNYNVIEKSIKKNHNYQLPQIIKLDIADGLPAYIDWVKATIICNN